MAKKAEQEIKPPMTAQDALALWDAGKPVPGFQVEAEGSEQNEIYAAAFDLIAERPSPHPLSDRERDVAFSIAQVAKLNGWAAMLRQHIGPHIPAITVQKK
jgi:hypothetical protein